MFDTDTSVSLDEDSVAAVEELRSVREAIKTLKARESELRAELLDLLDGVDQGVNGSGVPVVEVDRQVRTRLDSKRLQALYVDAWNDCQTETVVAAVRLPDSGI